MVNDWNSMKYCKEMDPTAWDLAQSEWLDHQISDDQIFTLNNSSIYFRLSDVETFIENNSADE